MTNLCVDVQSVSKKFARSLKRSLVYGAQDLLRSALDKPPQIHLRSSEFWALRNISLQLEQGKSLGIVGMNGCGKTTLLRIICGIFNPTTGTVRTQGNIAPLLALGAGFKPVLSGRENVFLNLSLLGMSLGEIRKNFNDIVDFAELSESIDAPLGTYSSGMRSRLGFACAVHTNPSLLIVDEVLSVGDTRFRMKCRNKINALRKQGTSLLLVSHSAVTVEALCDECLYLVGGQMAAYGKSVEVLERYAADSNRQTHDHNSERTLGTQAPAPVGLASLSVESITISCGPRLAHAGYLQIAEPGRFEFVLNALATISELSINVLIAGVAESSNEVCQLMTSVRDMGRLTIPTGRHSVVLDLPEVVFKPGVYRLKVSVSQGEHHDILASTESIKLIVRDKDARSQFPCHQPRTWRVDGADALGFDGTPDADLEAQESF